MARPVMMANSTAISSMNPRSADDRPELAASCHRGGPPGEIGDGDMCLTRLAAMPTRTSLPRRNAWDAVPQASWPGPGCEIGSPALGGGLARAFRGLHRDGMIPTNDPATSSVLAALNERSREIFRRIVDTYLATGEPVGSRHLSRLLPMTLSPASVRNVMQDLEELGLVFAPHTSAGRLPTQLGLRFFVDALLEIGDLSDSERRRIEADLRAASQSRTLESALVEATSLLSGLTRGAGVVVTSKGDARLKHIEFLRLEPERALAILVGEDGSVENRVVHTPAGLPARRWSRPAITSTPAFVAGPWPKRAPKSRASGRLPRANSIFSRGAWSTPVSPDGRDCRARRGNSSCAAKPISSTT